MVKNLPTVQETGVQFLGQGDPLEKEMKNHSSILAWRIPRTEEAGGLQSMELQTARHDLAAKPPPPPQRDLHMKPKGFTYNNKNLEMQMSINRRMDREVMV